MKYIFMHERQGDSWIDCTGYDDLRKAIKSAEIIWESLTWQQRGKVKFFGIIESVNPDEEAPDHGDGEVVWDKLAIEAAKTAEEEA